MMEKIQQIREQMRNSGDSGAEPTEMMGAEFGSMPNANWSRELVYPMSGLDAAISPEEYMLGPGDELTIHIWGTSEKNYTVAVNGEGVIAIPLLGLVDVSGKTLAEAKELLHERILSVHHNVEVVVVLSSIRKFKAYVQGEVRRPGTYSVDGATRVSELLEMAGGLTRRGRSRGIVLTNQTLGERVADLAIYRHLGDLSKNPYLYPGDRLFVPPQEQIVQINGAVNYPEVYAFLPGDDLEKLIEVGGGFTRNVDSSRIIISRFIDSVDSLLDTTLVYGESKRYPLRRDDRILVCGVPDYRVHRSVEIEGEILYPGIYPIERNKTRLAEVIKMAGGFTDEAFLKGSVILRKEFSSPGDREFERVRNTPIESLTPIERSFLKTKLTENEGRISIDFSELFGKNQKLYDVVLRDGDKITIARRSTSVHVMGAVVSPGLITHRGGADVNFYVKQAGGYNTKARKHQVTIIKAGTGIWLKPHEVERIEAGDAVYVPEKEYRDGVQVLKDTLVILGSIATLVLTTLTVQDIASR